MRTTHCDVCHERIGPWSQAEPEGQGRVELTVSRSFDLAREFPGDIKTFDGHERCLPALLQLIEQWVVGPREPR